MDAQTLERYLVQYGGNIVAATGQEIARIEQLIRSHVPEARHIDIVHSVAGSIRETRSPTLRSQ